MSAGSRGPEEGWSWGTARDGGVWNWVREERDWAFEAAAAALRRRGSGGRARAGAGGWAALDVEGCGAGGVIVDGYVDVEVEVGAG